MIADIFLTTREIRSGKNLLARLLFDTERKGIVRSVLDEEITQSAPATVSSGTWRPHP